MIISAKVIKKPRTKRLCSSGGDEIDGSHVRLYGAAHKGDKPYVIYECVRCARRAKDIKIREALSAI